MAVNEARLALEPSGVITGAVRTASAVIRGKVDGDLESQQDLTIGETGVVNADAIASGPTGSKRCRPQRRACARAALTSSCTLRATAAGSCSAANGSALRLAITIHVSLPA